MKLLDDEWQEFVITETLAREVDRTQLQPLTFIGFRDQPAERVGNDPTIDARCNAVPLGRLNEQSGGDDAAVFIAHAQ